MRRVVRGGRDRYAGGRRRALPRRKPAETGSGIIISQLRAQDVGGGNWNMVVQASAPSGGYHLVNDFAPYPYDFRNGDEMSFTFNNASAGQRVQFIFTDGANEQLREERTLTLV